MQRENLIEIKKGQEGYGLLIEHDGYISAECGDNKKIFEDINSNKSKEFFCPNPFIVSAVFQKYGTQNANGRIYPEHILKREVENYQQKIAERRAIGECYRPEAKVLTETGWKHLYEVNEGENILTFNTNTYSVEVQPIKKLIKYQYNGKMINIKGENINDIVTPNHGYPAFDNDDKFKHFVTAEEIMNGDISDYYVPSELSWGEFNYNNGIIPLGQKDLTISQMDYNGDVMCVEVENHIWYVMDNDKCHWTKNCNHPSETVIDLSRVAINIVELHWEGHTLVGKMEVLVSEGYRRHGIISCEGDQIAHLLLNNIKIGVSSRGMGTVTNKMGVLYVSDDFELVCFDVVSDPSTKNAWVCQDGIIPERYLTNESYLTPKNRSQLLEKLESFNDWLNE